MTDEITSRNRLQWMRKPSLREVYQDLYRRMAAECVLGTTLEVGGGSGNFKEYLPRVISSDISPAQWLDLVADAQRLPFAAETLANIVLFDVLHHLEFPMLFLREAERTLVSGGRLLMVEPAITPVSWPFYRFIHDEPVVLRCNPLDEGCPDPARAPYEANQAVPTLIFGRFLEELRTRVPALVLSKVEWVSQLAYPLTGGFNPWTLISSRMVSNVLAVENALPGFLRRLMAFRMLIVVEKADRQHDSGGLR